MQQQHLNQYINIYLHRESRQDLLWFDILLWPPKIQFDWWFFYFSVHGDWQRIIYLQHCIPHPKEYKGANFHEDWLYRTQVITISLDTENSKQQISEKKILKLSKFQQLVSQEPFKVRWKDFTHFCFLLVGTLDQNLIKIWEDGWQNWKFCPYLM